MQSIWCQIGHNKCSFKKEGKIRSERPLYQIYSGGSKELLDTIIQLAAWCFPQSIGEVIVMAKQFVIKLNESIEVF
jgi:hypothetical protein